VLKAIVTETQENQASDSTETDKKCVCGLVPTYENSICSNITDRFEMKCMGGWVPTSASVVSAIVDNFPIIYSGIH
jgi:hypothetical protein